MLLGGGRNDRVRVDPARDRIISARDDSCAFAFGPLPAAAERTMISSPSSPATGIESFAITSSPSPIETRPIRSRPVETQCMVAALAGVVGSNPIQSNNRILFSCLFFQYSAYPIPTYIHSSLHRHRPVAHSCIVSKGFELRRPQYRPQEDQSESLWIRIDQAVDFAWPRPSLH